MKYTIILMFVLITQILVSQVDESFKKIRYLVNEEPTREITLIDSIEKDYATMRVRFTKPDFYNSGDLAYTCPYYSDTTSTVLAESKGSILERSKRDQGAIYVSAYGDYYLVHADKVDYTLYNRGNKINTISLDYDPGYLSETGKLVCRNMRTEELVLIDIDGTIRGIEKLHDYSKNVNTLNFYPFINKNGLIAGIAYKGNDWQEDMFPTGSRLFFFDNNLKIKEYVDLDGAPIYHPWGISNEKNYMLFWDSVHGYNVDYNKAVTHIYQNNKEIMRINGAVKTYSFSPDESLLLLNVFYENGSGCYIIDLEKRKIIKRLRGLSARFAIADKGYPYIAFVDHNMFYVIDYENEKLITKSWVGPANKRFFKNALISISGNGKTVSVFEHRWFKKVKL